MFAVKPLEFVNVVPDAGPVVFMDGSPQASSEVWLTTLLPFAPAQFMFELGAVTAAVCAEVAEIEPPALVAVTTVRIVWPTSPLARV